jgi:hypothetical protein
VLSKAFLAHELDDATIVARVRLECVHSVLLTRALELHEWRRTARLRARRTGASIDLEYDGDGSLTGTREPADANRGTVWQRALVEDAVHAAFKVYA